MNLAVIKKNLCSYLKTPEVEVSWLAGDGSDRSYYRVSAPDRLQTYVLMELQGEDVKKLHSGEYDWIKLSNFLSFHNICVPRLIHAFNDLGVLIIEDYGGETFETYLQKNYFSNKTKTLTDFFDPIFQILYQFLKLPSDIWTTRAFDEEKYNWELNFFEKKFLTPVCKIELTKNQRQQFDHEVKFLSRELAPYSKYFTHRDFHSRNLMVLGGKHAVIDFQDARYGAASYDLVSICFDSYIPLAAKERCFLLQKFLEYLKKQNETNIVQEIEHTWARILLQRQLKAMGSFGYLSIDKKKGDYLKNVPAALQTLLDAITPDEKIPFLSQELLQMMKAKK